MSFDNWKNLGWTVLATAAVAFPDLSQAASGDLTFLSFYKEDNTIFWAGAVLAALVAGAVIVFSAGTATPVVSGIGSWIGGLMGYSGVAATNAGLAWLGGGALAAGGYGMVGGAALLTAVFTFGTELVFDATITNRQEAYNYAAFTKSSQKMVTLPLPRNDNGPESVEAAFKILKVIDEDANLRDPRIQIEIERALAILTSTRDDSITAAENARKKTFTAILEMILGRPKAAQTSAAEAYELAATEQIVRVTPAFLLAVTELHEEAPDLKKADSYLEYAVDGERDNPLTPLMVKMYADRLTARISDGTLAPNSTAGIMKLIVNQPDEKLSAVNFGMMAGQLFSAIKIEQQRLLYLLRTDNETLLTSPNTAERATAVLSNFREFLGQVDQLLKHGDERITKQLDRSVTPAWAKSWAAEWLKFHSLLGAYKGEVPELVQELESFKSRFEKPAPTATEGYAGRNPAWTIFLLAIFLVFGIAGGMMYERRRKTAAES